MKLNKGFIFGVATAAYQAEGATKEDGKGPCYWDEYLADTKSFDPNMASDFYHKYKEDLALCQQFGINGIRISIAWSRILPEGTGQVNEKAIAFYNNLIDECIKNGVEPFVTLHHFDTPLSLFKQGDWLNDATIDAFCEYAKVCFTHFGDRVKKWITINEPWSLAAGQYIVGHFPPNVHNSLEKAAQAMHKMMVAHARVVNLYKKMNLNGEIGVIHILEPKFSISDKEADCLATINEHTFCNRFMLDATIYGEYQSKTLDVMHRVIHANNGTLHIREDEMQAIKEASEKLDFLGINYYQSHFMEAYDGETNIHHNGTGEKGTSIYAVKGTGKRVVPNDIATTDWDWLIYPEGLYKMILEVVNDYGFKKPIYITENGIGMKDEIVHGKVEDQKRIAYVESHLAYIAKAVEEGANVQGYFMWSLMDMFSWTNGYNKRYGLFYVDFATQERTAKQSAYWYKQLAQETNGMVK